MFTLINRLAVLGLAVVTFGSVLAGGPSPAAAEIDAPQATGWGLKTEAPTNNLGQWAALGWAVEEVGGTMFVGGKFAEVTNGANTESQPYFAAFDSGDGRFLNWIRPAVGGAVTALETAPDGNLFVGGEMGTWNGTTYGSLVKIDPVTGDVIGNWPTRVYGGSGIVRDIRLEHDGWLYVVGSFTTASDGNGPRSVSGAIRMNPNTGAIDWGWTPDVNGGSVWGVSVSHTRSEIYLAGWFTNVANAADTSGFASVNATGAVVRNRSTIPFNTCNGCSSAYRLYDVVATTSGDVWTVGEQHALFILHESSLALRLMHYTGCNLSYQPDCNRRGGEFQELEELGGRMYAAGHYWGSHMTDTSIIWHSYSAPGGTYTGSVNAVTAYDIGSGDRIQSFNPPMSGTTGGFSLALSSDGCLWATGAFNTVGTNHAPARDLVRLCDTGGAGPDPQPNPMPPGPKTCSIEAADNSVTVDWANQAGIEGTVVERSVNGGNWSWRGFVAQPGDSFTDSLPNSSVEYRVKHRYQGQWFSGTVDCGSTAPAAQCSVSLDGDAATVSWSGAVGNVVIRRNNGWVSTAGQVASGTYTDGGLSPGTYDYTLRVWHEGSFTDVACGDVTVAVQGPSCTATNWRRGIQVQWDQVPGYPIVRRNNSWLASTNQGTTSYWDAYPAAGTYDYVIRVWSNGTYSDVVCPTVTR